MARTEGIGRLVLGMPVEDKRKFFKAAFKSITLDGYGPGLWRQRSVKACELSDPLNTFMLHIGRATAAERGLGGIRELMVAPHDCLPVARPA